MTTNPELPLPIAAACDADRRHEPISGTVVWFAPQVDPYRLPTPQRLAVADESMETIQVPDEGAARTTDHVPSILDQRQVWRVPDDAAFAALCAAHAAAQHTLDALALAFRRLGRYDVRLAAAGGIRVAPNPLTPTVIAVLDPDAPPRGNGALAVVPPFVRCPVRAHTPKML